MTTSAAGPAEPEAPKPIFVLLGSHTAAKHLLLKELVAIHRGELIRELFDGAAMAVFPRFVIVAVDPHSVAHDVYAPIARAALVIERAPAHVTRAHGESVVVCAARRGPNLARPDQCTTSAAALCNLANPHDVTIALCGLLRVGVQNDTTRVL